jgi:hypothetical protein
LKKKFVFIKNTYKIKLYYHQRLEREMKTTVSGKRLVICILLVNLIMACNIGSPAETADPGLEETKVAMGIQMTMMAMQQETLNAEQAAAANPPAEQAQPADQQTAQQPTYTPYPTYTPIPAQPTATQPPAPTAVPAMAMADRIRGANILIFEDMMANYDVRPYVHAVIDEMNFSGGKVLEVGDALGNFKNALLSSTRWDLIIVAAENRTLVQGEFWGYIEDQLNNDVAVIAEVWYLDQHYTDIQPIFRECGIKYQQNWERPWNFNSLDYSLYPLDQYHPVFSEPNSGINLGTSWNYWVGVDAGDIIRLDSGGDATLLAGLYPDRKSDYGVLANCMDGKLIIQTFSTHDYPENDVKDLWENYITHTLTKHFEALDARQ